MTIPLETSRARPGRRSPARPIGTSGSQLAARGSTPAPPATLFDEHPFTTLTDVVRAKLEPPAASRPRTPRCAEAATSRPAIAEWWSDEHGIAVYEPDVMYVRRPAAGDARPAHRRQRHRRRRDQDDGQATSAGPSATGGGRCQAQMYCADLERVHLAVLDASMTLATYVVERDDDAIARARRAAPTT